MKRLVDFVQLWRRGGVSVGGGGIQQVGVINVVRCVGAGKSWIDAAVVVVVDVRQHVGNQGGL